MSHPRVTHDPEVIEIVLFFVRLFLSLQLLARKDPAEEWAKTVDQDFNLGAIDIGLDHSLLCCGGLSHAWV